jgi:hypothetical protein
MSSDVRVGQRDDLTAIGRIGEDFLVAGQAGIEDDLTRSLTGRPERGSAKPAPVL